MAKKSDIQLLEVCFADARQVLASHKMMDMQSHVISIALAFFRERSRVEERRAGGRR
jgi:hypothetical protein